VAVSGWLVLLVALGAVPVVVLGEFRVLPVWLALVLVVATVDLLLAGSPRSLRLTRDLPDRIRLGETAVSVLLVTNTGGRVVRGTLRDGWPPSAGAAPGRARIRIPSGERRAVTTSLTPFRRGDRRAAHVTVRSFGPLGLVARQATIAERSVLRVLPRFDSRKHLPSRLARLRELDGSTSVQVRGAGTEFDSLREYVRGDDVRSLDWRATARRSSPHGAQLVVRTWRPERDRRVVIVVDSSRTSAARVGDEPRLDTAFESALLLAALADRAGDRVDLVVYDRRVRARVQGASGADLLGRMVLTMGPLQPELIEMDWATVPALVRGITSSRALVVLMTAVDSPGASRALLATLPQLTRRHLVVVASVADPQVVEATSDRSDGTAVYRAASAERTLLDVSRTQAALRQLGAEVVTGTPADLPPTVADRYLALKRAGRL
jgi:uncharacterized protein (DUF58 family)